MVEDASQEPYVEQNHSSVVALVPSGVGGTETPSSELVASFRCAVGLYDSYVGLEVFAVRSVEKPFETFASSKCLTNRLLFLH